MAKRVEQEERDQLWSFPQVLVSLKKLYQEDSKRAVETILQHVPKMNYAQCRQASGAFGIPKARDASTVAALRKLVKEWLLKRQTDFTGRQSRQTERAAVDGGDPQNVDEGGPSDMEGIAREKRKAPGPPSPVEESQGGTTPFFTPNRPPPDLQQTAHTPVAMAKAIRSAFTDIQDGLSLVAEQGMGCSSVVNSIQRNLTYAQGMLAGWLTAVESSNGELASAPTRTTQAQTKKTFIAALKETLPVAAQAPPPRLPEWKAETTYVLIPDDESQSKQRIAPREFAAHVTANLRITGNRVVRAARTPRGGFKILLLQAEDIPPVLTSNHGTWQRWKGHPQAKTTALVIHRVDKAISEPTIKDDLITCNENITSENLLSVTRLRRKKPTSTPDANIVMEDSLSVKIVVSTQLGEEILQQGNILCDYMYHTVRRYERVIKCDHCGKEGHYSSACWAHSSR